MGSLILTTFIAYLGTSFPALGHTPKEGKIWGTVGPYVYRTGSESVLAAQSPSLGAGIVAEGDVDDNGGVEVAMFYMDKLYLRRHQGTLLGERIKRMYIATGYRHWFVPWLSSALSFFSAYSMGDAKVVEGDAKREDDLRTTAGKVTEHGADLSLEWEVWGDEKNSFVIDGHYSKSLTAHRDETSDMFGIFLGLKSLIPKSTSHRK